MATVVWRMTDYLEYNIVRVAVLLDRRATKGVAMQGSLIGLTPWLVGLWGLWAITLASSLFGGRLAGWFRLASSFTLVIAGWNAAWLNQSTADQGFGVLIAMGMTLGFVGDLLMARVFPLRRYLLAGMAAFGLGHVAYIAAALSLGNTAGLNAAGPRFGAWIVWLAIGGFGWLLVVFRNRKATAANAVLPWVALPYALLLASTAGFATGLALQARRFVPFAVGAALFLFSDLILAGRLFGGLRFRRLDDIIWLTYGPGQMSIVFSSLL